MMGFKKLTKVVSFRLTLFIPQNTVQGRCNTQTATPTRPDSRSGPIVAKIKCERE